VLENGDLVYSHIGARRTNGEYHCKIGELKQNLAKEGRIYDIDRFISDSKVLEMFFKSAEYILLPYQNHYASSGIMAQALSYGKPVLVPDTGLMAARVRDYNLGRIFKHLCYESFVSEFKILRKEFGTYSRSIKEYYENTLTRSRIYEALDRMFNGQGLTTPFE